MRDERNLLPPRCGEGGREATGWGRPEKAASAQMRPMPVTGPSQSATAKLA